MSFNETNLRFYIQTTRRRACNIAVGLLPDATWAKSGEEMSVF